MSLVNMTCENCGAPLKKNGDHYICEYCGSVVIHIPGGEGEYSEGMSPGELKQKLFESGRSYTVVFPSEEEGDIDAAIIRGKLRLAEKQLAENNRRHLNIHTVAQAAVHPAFRRTIQTKLIRKGFCARNHLGTTTTSNYIIIRV